MRFSTPGPIFSDFRVRKNAEKVHKQNPCKTHILCRISCPEIILLFAGDKIATSESTVLAAGKHHPPFLLNACLVTVPVTKREIYRNQMCVQIYDAGQNDIIMRLQTHTRLRIFFLVGGGGLGFVWVV